MIRWFVFGLTSALALTVASLTAGGSKTAHYRLPEPAVKALKAAFPDAVIGRTDWDKDLGDDPRVFSTVLKDKTAEFVTRVTAGGVIIDVQTRAGENDLAPAVIKTIKAADDAARIAEVRKFEVRAVPVEFKAKPPDGAAKWAIINKPATEFVVTVTKDKERKFGTLKLRDDGKLIHKLAWKDMVHAAGQAATGKLVIRVHCGSDNDYTDLAGVTWSADQRYAKEKKWGYSNGKAATRQGMSLPMSDAPAIYLSERSALDNYRFDVPAGKYTVRVHLCETSAAFNEPGQRSFGVKIHGKLELKNFDVVRESGFMKPFVHEVKDVDVADGKLLVEFIDYGKHQDPLVNALEVIGQ